MSTDIQPGSPKNIHVANAETEANQAGADIKSAGEHAAKGAKEGVKGAAQKTRNGMHRAASATKSAARSSKQGVVDAYSATLSGATNFKGQVSNAYSAGASSQTYTRGLPAKPSFLQTTGSYLKAPFTSTSYVIGHTVSNPSHGTREINSKITLSRCSKVLAGAAAVWLGALSLAGASTRHLGFLAQPVPHFFGISLPGVAWTVGEVSVAIMAILIAIRVGVALVSKFQEMRAASSATVTGESAPASTATEAAKDATEATKEAADTAAETANEASTSGEQLAA